MATIVLFSSITVFLLLVSVHSIRVVKDSTSPPDYGKPNVVVASDGSGEFETLTEAIKRAPINSQQPYVMHLKAGKYTDYPTVNKPNIVMVGAGMNFTFITGNRSNAKGYSTAASATLIVNAPNFVAINLTIENTSPHTDGPAVALSMNNNRSVVYRCAIRGNQDTLYAYSGRQFYKNCIITGTVDFIFGYATAVFQNCHIEARNFQSTVVTANGRNRSNDNTGFVMQFCGISRTSDLPLKPANTFLGRPWREYSRTVIMQSFLDGNINLQGWNSNMTATSAGPTATLYFGEYMNHGPGSDLSGRVKWSGFHVLNSGEAKSFTVNNFIAGNTWLPATGIPYIGGLS